MSDSTFPALVANELVYARKKFPEPCKLPSNWEPSQLAHYWNSVVAEEYREFRDEVESCDYIERRVLKELVQLAAMCQRAAESLELCKVSS